MYFIEVYKSLLKNRLQSPLPGKKAQFKMAAYQGRLDTVVPADAKKAAVLLLLYQIANDIHTVFIERIYRAQDKHSGQISFPGGQLEKNDPSLEHCALREAEEEIGISSEKVEIIGRLTPLYIPVSNFFVYPVLGTMNEKPVFSIQQSEVKTVIPVQLKKLLDEKAIKRKDLFILDTYTLKDVPHFDIENKIIWGATAMILGEFLTIFKEIR